MSEEETENVRECVKEQISEIELLQSMYRVPDELEFDDDFDLAYSNNFVNEREETPPPPTEFCVKLQVRKCVCVKVEDGGQKFGAAVTFYLPLTYPLFRQLNSFARCNSMKPTCETKLNDSLQRYLADLPLGAPRIFDCLTFIQNYVAEYSLSSSSATTLTETSLKNGRQTLRRIWIYSHHIYSKFKRRSILSLSSQLNLSGFCMPGKPGFICVEGYAQDCQEFWTSIKMWSWKKIEMRHQEDDELKNDIELSRKFDNFKEIGFDGFKIYLDEHKCSYAFSLLCGFESQKA